MTTIRLHIHCNDWQGRPTQRTYVIREFVPGSVDIVRDNRPLCEADRTAVFHATRDEDLVLEVEYAG